MDSKKIARELIEAARDLAGAERPNPLDGRTKRSAANFVNKLLRKYGQAGIFRNETSWRPLKILWDELRDEGIPFDLKSAEYGISPSGRQMGLGMPDNKTWKFEIEFLNDRGRPTRLYGIVIASGAGTVEDPMGSYDLNAYVS